MIDWTLAQRIAGGVAGAPDPGSNAAGELPGDLVEMTERAREGVVAYTRLTPARAVPAPESVDRAVWLEANLETMRGTLDPLVARLGGSGPLAAPMRAAGGALIAAEIGAITGFMARHVLGQYDLALLDPARPPRLLLVAPNLHEAARSMDVAIDDLLPWVVFHEVTHAVQFTSVPWLADHLGSLLRELLDSVELRIDPSALLRLPSGDDLRGLWDSLREGGLVGAVAGPERKALLDRLQATMALIEGHAELVMDGAGAPALPNLPALREALDRRRREKSPLVKVIERLLGLEMKLRQYELGRRFCDGVVERGGIEALNRAWTGPQRLPRIDELEDPAAWIRRTAVRSVTAPK